MQKKLIAMAIAGLVSGGAFAQATTTNVTLSGNIGASLDTYSLSGATTARSTYKQNMVSDQSSAIIVKGEEDLGSGLKAWFQIDSRLTMDRGNGGVNNYSTGLQTSGLGNGNTAIGFKGNFGTMGIGRWDVHYDAFAPIGDVVTAGSLASRIGYFGAMAQVNGAQIALGTRAANVVFYDSPSMAGFKVRFGYSTAPAGGEGEAALGSANDPGKGNAWQIKANYDNGPINLVASLFRFNVEDRGAFAANQAMTVNGIASAPTAGAFNPADQKSLRLGGAYTMPFGLKVGLGWDRSSIDSTAGEKKRTAWMIPIGYTMGASTFHFNYARAGNTSNVAGDTKADELLLAYGYNFSKRTSVGVQYVHVKTGSAGLTSVAGASAGNTGLTAPTAGEDGKLLSFNVRHFF